MSTKTETASSGNAVVARVLNRLGNIATLPDVTLRVIEVVEDPEGTAYELHRVIKSDPVLSAKILKVVNSSLYGLPGQIGDVNRAIVMLGLSAVKNIATAASMAQMFNGRHHPDLFSAKALWRHSVAVGVAAKKISQVAHCHAPPDEMFLAGLLHDIGLLIERQTMPRELAEVARRCRDGEGSLLMLETKVIGANHQDFGEALATKWGFPPQLCAAVGTHHDPGRSPESLRTFPATLRCADILCCQESLGFDLPAWGDELDADLLDQIEVTEAQLTVVREELGGALQEAEAVLG
jgi:putative nucleotidyltransferase with HDIG domain